MPEVRQRSLAEARQMSNEECARARDAGELRDLAAAAIPASGSMSSQSTGRRRQPEALTRERG
jgi:hypothetical protein